MTAHQQKVKVAKDAIEAARRAVDEVFGDTTVPRAVTRVSLSELAEEADLAGHIDTCLESLTE